MKRLSLGLGVGVLIGVLASKAWKQEQLTPEAVLKRVKATVQQEYMISGSWIHMQPESITRFGLPYEAYRGGITSSTTDGPVQYEFLADVKTGVLLDLQEI
ncbi:hypothetical protein ACTHP3_18915 [Shouchella rhizosphaerae]|uniref:hypothetical protein n=1 Tax=Shouchella rhizosphaerae TaxID=866786 RepID=UPI003F807081